jgi:hypothetical protein
MEKLKEKWGYQKLPDLMEASEYFDITKEELKNGGYRWVYRSKPSLAYAASYLLIQAVTDTAIKTCKTDGWASLVTAAQHIETSCSQELSEVTEKHGCQSLYSFMVESDLFEWKPGSEDSDDNMYYRLKQS